MFAKNSDLYADETASCSAFSSTRRLAYWTSWFLASTSMFWSARRLACLARSSLDARSSSWRDRSSSACDCDCLSRFSVSVLASIVLSTRPMLSVSWIQERLVRGAEAGERRQLDDGAHRALEQDRQHDDVQRRGLAEARVDLHVVAGDVGEQDALLLLGALADEAFAQPEGRGEVLSLLVAVSGLEAQHRLAAVLGGQRVEDAVLGRDQRRQLGQDHARHGGQVALALEHAGEALAVGLQPVLLDVLPVVSRRLRIISLSLSLRTATSPLASTRPAGSGRPR